MLSFVATWVWIASPHESDAQFGIKNNARRLRARVSTWISFSPRTLFGGRIFGVVASEACVVRSRTKFEIASRTSAFQDAGGPCKDTNEHAKVAEFTNDIAPKAFRDDVFAYLETGFIYLFRNMNCTSSWVRDWLRSECGWIILPISGRFGGTRFVVRQTSRKTNLHQNFSLHHIVSSTQTGRICAPWLECE